MKNLKFFKIYKESPTKENSKIFLIIDNLRIELHNRREFSLLLEEDLQILNFITKNDNDEDRRKHLILATAIKRANDDAFIFNSRFEKIIWEEHRL